MKILALGHSIAHYRQRSLWQWIASQGHKVDTIVMPSYRDEVYENINKDSFTQNLMAPVNSAISNMWFFPHLHEAVFHMKPDIIMAVQEPWTYATYHALNVAKAFDIPFGFFSWENIPKTFPEPFRYFEHKACGDSDFIIGGNVDAAEVLARKGARNVFVLPQTGLDPNLFTPHPKLMVEDKGKQPRHILFVGRLTEAKGIRTILNAVDLMKTDYILRFVGGRGELEGLIRSHPEFGKKITIEPWMDYEKLPDIYNWADVSLMPSVDTPEWIEQMGYVVGESLLCHVPVITSASKSIAELWNMPGVYFNAQGDAGGLSDLLDSDNLYTNGAAAKGRQAVIDTYSVAKIGEHYINVFKKVLKIGD